MYQKKKAIWLIFLTFFISLVLPTGNPLTVSAQDDEKVYDIATDVTFPPFEFENAEGEFVGIDIDILHAIAEDQGFEFNIMPMNFSAGLQALEAGQVDGMIAAMGITPERQESFDFSDPYFEAGPVLAVAETNDEIQSYDDLDGKTIAVKVGTTGAEFANEFAEEYDITINQFEDSATMYADVEAGHSDGTIDDYPVMAYAIQQGLALRFPEEPASGDNYGFAVNKGENQELLEMFNAGLATIMEDGTYDEIIDRYLGTEAEVTTGNSMIDLFVDNFPDRKSTRLNSSH